jgi:hypothetical protein
MPGSEKKKIFYKRAAAFLRVDAPVFIIPIPVSAFSSLRS